MTHQQPSSTLYLSSKVRPLTQSHIQRHCHAPTQQQPRSNRQNPSTHSGKSSSTVPPVCAHAEALLPKQRTASEDYSQSVVPTTTHRHEQQQSSNPPDQDQQFNTRDTAHEAPLAQQHSKLDNARAPRCSPQPLSQSRAQFQQKQPARRATTLQSQDQQPLTHVAVEQPQHSHSSSRSTTSTRALWH